MLELNIAGIFIGLTFSDTKLIVCLTLSVLLIVTESKEYCQFESFNASCSANQVIVMEDAQYGRIKTGRCVARDYGYMGCSMSVLHLLDRTCSGRRWCEYAVPKLRELVQPCPKDLISYLEATYRCVAVNDLSAIRCNSSIFLDTTNSTLYISGVHDIDQPHGATSGNAIGAGSVPSSAVAFYNSCPLHVRARPRQSINFTLYSFGHYLDHDDTDSTTGLRFCSANLFIAEGQRRHSSPLCPARQRQRNLYLSHDSILTLYFSQQPRKLLNSFNRWTFILKIESVGCADYAPDPNSWVERFDDKLILHCNSTSESWHLTCRDNQWMGQYNNTVLCGSEVVFIGKNEKISTEEIRIPYGLVVAVSSGIVLGFIVGFAMLLFVFVHRQRGRHLHHSAVKLDSFGCQQDGESTALYSDEQQQLQQQMYPQRIFLECRYSTSDSPMLTLGRAAASESSTPSSSRAASARMAQAATDSISRLGQQQGQQQQQQQQSCICDTDCQGVGGGFPQLLMQRQQLGGCSTVPWSARRNEIQQQNDFLSFGGGRAIRSDDVIQFEPSAEFHCQPELDIRSSTFAGSGRERSAKVTSDHVTTESRDSRRSSADAKPDLVIIRSDRSLHSAVADEISPEMTSSKEFISTKEVTPSNELINRPSEFNLVQAIDNLSCTDF